MWKKATATFWSIEESEPSEEMYDKTRKRLREALISAVIPTPPEMFDPKTGKKKRKAFKEDRKVVAEDLEFSEIKHHSPGFKEDDNGRFQTDWENREWALTMHVKVEDEK